MAAQLDPTLESTAERRVLLVDDDSDFASALADVLQSSGYDTRIAHDIPMARETVEQFHPPVALIDIRLGQQTGIELLSELHERHPEMLIVMMTAYAGTETAIRAMQQGAYDYLMKPLAAEELLLTLDRCFERLQLGEKKVAAEAALRERDQQLFQIQKLESIGRLAGGVAHDLNNMLAPILGNAELMLQELHPDDPRHQQTHQILQAARRARHLTRQLLAFGRKQVLQQREASLGGIVRDFEEMIRRTLRENIDLRCRIEDEGAVVCDPSQIEQILMNLALNAQDAMPDGGVLTIETADVDIGVEGVERFAITRPGQHVVLTVRDTGTGMDRETRERAFEPFFTTKGAGGTGLGLATIYGIVRQHAGGLALSSEEGRGTTFEICLPRSSSTAPSPMPGSTRPEPEHGSETILLLEDDRMVRDLTRRMLERYGYQVLPAEDPTTCLQIANEKSSEISLLLTDVLLPEMNGREVYERLLKSSPELRVVYMSGYTEDVIDYHGILQPGVDYLQKPFSLYVLLETVRRVLDRE